MDICIKGSVIMETKNDDRVLQLKDIINKKKSELKNMKKFIPATNCIIELDGNKYNLNVLSYDNLQLLLIKLNMYFISAKDLEIDLQISGYPISEWMTDIKSKIEILEFKKKESDLKVLETKLDKLLSDEKKTELELNEIAELLK